MSFFSPYILDRFCQGPQCSTHNCHECHVKFLLHLYVYTCFTHKYFIGVGDSLRVYSKHAHEEKNRINDSKVFQTLVLSHAFQACI